MFFKDKWRAGKSHMPTAHFRHKDHVILLSFAKHLTTKVYPLIIIYCAVLW